MKSKMVRPSYNRNAYNHQKIDYCNHKNIICIITQIYNIICQHSSKH